VQYIFSTPWYDNPADDFYHIVEINREPGIIPEIRAIAFASVVLMAQINTA
jgi:hypothetical protein